ERRRVGGISVGRMAVRGAFSVLALMLRNMRFMRCREIRYQLGVVAVMVKGLELCLSTAAVNFGQLFLLSKVAVHAEAPASINHWFRPGIVQRGRAFLRK